MENPRAVAAKILQQIIFDGRSLSSLIPQQLSCIDESKDKALAQAIVFGVMRWFETLDFITVGLLKSPLKEKDKDILVLMLMGIYQLRDMRVPEYAAISETVKLVPKKKRIWAKGLLNAVLRQYQRNKKEIEETVADDLEAKTSHPGWLLERLQTDWPDKWSDIIDANNSQGTMTLRVNVHKNTRNEYLALLSEKGVEAEPTRFSDYGIVLTSAVDVNMLPGFDKGLVSVQDEAAQLAAQLLAPQKGDLILDACSAPGGKTAALLEREPGARVTALDVSPQRLEQVEQTLRRLSLKAETRAADAKSLADIFPAAHFDRILLDVPCSATGVIRRNPDVKFHRTSDDIVAVVETQKEILDAAWKVLKPGGVLLYATCSIIRDENDKQIAKFIQQNSDAQEITISADWGIAVNAGRQIIPGQNGMDGFYYALLCKLDAAQTIA
ncbi:MAG: 16S rRNA (cytosine(967)-C(5))-methyltransferase RsmB [Gammaproteobacteria bacterium]|nr:16S rRNA (cytosine(967)-C(5))-methyltransferase RsmB [Gammaproteobacteria bacterium]